MKVNLKITLTALTLALALTSCKDKAKEAETSEVEQIVETKTENTSYNVDVDASSIAWKGFKPTGSHNGSIKIKSGSLGANGAAIASGAFVIDMNSITVLDIPAEEEGNAKLSGHLKAEDFFNVVAHPTSNFEITGVTEAEGKTMLSGNLTLKGTKNNITFPVSVTKNDGTITLTSEAFTIDRSKWNVKYGSKSFFDNLGDKFINDDIELKVTVVAKKA
jgi:polyisoprenoid-binding protein YceI